MTKGGVDTVDELSANFNISRNRKRWTLTVFFTLMNVAGTNATIKYNCNNEIKIKRKQFLKQLALMLIQYNLQKRQENPKFPRNIRSSLTQHCGEGEIPSF